MAKVDFCNTAVRHSFSLRTAENDSAIPLKAQDIVKSGNSNGPVDFAAASDDTSIAQVRRNAGATTNGSRLDGLTPLHIAIESGEEENVKLLLDSSARLDAKDLFGKTPLHHLAACINYRNEKALLGIAKLILQRSGVDAKAVLNECTDCCETALHLAIVNGSSELTKVFLAHGANANAKSRDGKSPLYMAIELNNASVAELLLQSGARVSERTSQGSTALHEAVTRRKERSVRLLLANGAEVNAKDPRGATPLQLAARLHYLDERVMGKIVRLLLDGGADANDGAKSAGGTAFHCVVVDGNERLVRLLLRHGADPRLKNADGKSALHLAIQYSSERVVKLLLDSGAEIDERCASDGKSAVHLAVAVEDVGMTRVLLERGADVNACDASGRSPLSLAFEVAHMRSIYNPWTGFCTAMHCASGRADESVFELLVKHVAKLQLVCEENERTIGKTERLRRFYGDCRAELARMRETRLCDGSGLSMHSLLTGSRDSLLGYARNENLAEAFRSSAVWATEFPIYYPMLRERFFKAERRVLLLQTSAAVFRWLVKPLAAPLPDLVVNEILGYLTTGDLVHLKMTLCA